MNVNQTSTFIKQVKKLHKNQKNDLDAAIKYLMDNPYAGELKKADLSAVRVYKFFMVRQLTLLAYLVPDVTVITLLCFGSHENFYRDLKK